MADLAIHLRERDEEGRGSWEVVVVGKFNNLPLVGITEEADGALYKVFNWISGEDEETHGETGDEFLARPFMADEPEYEAEELLEAATFPKHRHADGTEHGHDGGDVNHNHDKFPWRNDTGPVVESGATELEVEELLEAEPDANPLKSLPDEDLANGLMMVASMYGSKDVQDLIREAAFRLGERA